MDPTGGDGCNRAAFWRAMIQATGSARCCDLGSNPTRRCLSCSTVFVLIPIEALRSCAADAERDLLERGITFTVYSDATAIDRILPFDLIRG